MSQSLAGRVYKSGGRGDSPKHAHNSSSRVCLCGFVMRVRLAVACARIQPLNDASLHQE